MGNCLGITPPFAWFGSGLPQSIALPGAFDIGRAVGVNASNIVVGWMMSLTGVTSHRAFKTIDGAAVALAGPIGTVESEAHAINDTGIIVGYTATPAEITATYWERGTAHTIDLPIGPTSVGEGISDAGHICGWMGVHPSPEFTSNAFIWHNEIVTDLGIPKGATGTTANAVNNRGDACGYAIWPDPKTDYFVRRPCAWINGQFIDLGMIPGTVSGIAFDINDAGEIVGYCDFENGANVAFLWRNGVMVDLDTLVPAGSPRIDTARAINNRGQIVGDGKVFNPSHSVAILLTPALPAHAGDTDCDSQVNINDLLNVINRWNPQGPVGGEPADLNRDNKIDIWDLLETIFHWGQ